jgi:hypothetical protein
VPSLATENFAEWEETMKSACSLLIAIASLLPITMPKSSSEKIVVDSLVAQTSDVTPAVSTVFAVLTKSIESKSATVGQELSLKTITDIVVKGELVVAKGSTLLGRVKEVVIKTKEAPQSVLAVIIEKAVANNGSEVPLQAIIAAVAAPQNNSLDSDPTYGMMHSNEPKMAGSAGSASRTGGLSASSKAGSNAAVATAELKGSMDHGLLLDADSQGAVGYEGLSISWQLTTPPPVTVFAIKGKNVKLDAGTQVLLRMATPRISR